MESRMNPQSKPLFAALFPVSVADVTECPSVDKQANDWLENKSYGKKAVACVLELQTALGEQEAELPVTCKISEQEGDASSLIAPQTDASGLIAPQTDDRTTSADVSHHAAKKKSKHKNKHKKHKSIKTGSHDLSVDRATLFGKNAKKLFIEELSNLNTERVFTVDKKSDKNLWTYESIVKQHVSSYRRFGQSALGFQSNIYLSGIENLGGKKYSSMRYFEKTNRKLVKKVGRKLQVEVKETGPGGQYIILSQKDVHEEEVVMEDSFPQLGYDDTSKMCLEARVGSSAEEKPDTSLDGEVIQKVARYNKRLRENPSDIKLWLEFVSYQDHVFISENNRSSKSMIEKKLAILKHALMKNPGCLELQLAQLEICEQTWEKEDIVKQWNQLLFVHSSNVALWRRYLLYQQSCLASFSVAKMTKLYHKCLHVLVSAMDGRVKTARIEDDLSRGIIDIFYQYCVFLYQTGHTEKAVASFQAVIEFNLFCPAALQASSLEDCSAVFETFWDSSVPRFAEKGAIGWTNWDQQKSVEPRLPQSEANIEDAEEEIITQKLPIWKTWLQIESSREAAHWLPWCPDLDSNETEEDCEDLERLVLVDDVLPILFRVKDTDAHLRLVLYFLTFLGLDISKVVSELCLPQLEDADGRFLQLHLDELFQLGSTAAGLRSCFPGLGTRRETSSVRRTLLSLALAQAGRAFPGKYQTVFTLLQIHSELQKQDVQSLKDVTKQEAKGLRKFVKGLLKEKHNRSNLTVWNAYAWLEHELGNTEAAVGVAKTALAMCQQRDGGEDKSGISLLYLTYCQLTLSVSPHLHLDSVHRKEEASELAKSHVTSAIASLAHESPFKPDVPTTLVSRTMRKLKSFVGSLAEKVVVGASRVNVIDWEELSQSCRQVLTHTSCLALYEVCHRDITSALAHYTDVLSILDSVPTEKSHTCVRTLRVNIYRQELIVVQHCMSSGGVPLHHLRHVLDAALAEFPEDVQFFQSLVDMELRSHIVGRLRRYIDMTVVHPRSSLTFVYSILAEVKRISVLSQDQVNVVQWSTTGVMNRIRRLMELGSQHSVSQHCPLLWRIYYHLEVSYGERERAVGLYYKALQQCPWAKMVYVDGVRLFGAERLQELVDLMTEKELRVQIPVEELDLLTEPQPVLDNKPEPMDSGPELQNE